MAGRTAIVGFVSSIIIWNKAKGSLKSWKAGCAWDRSLHIVLSSNPEGKFATLKIHSLIEKGTFPLTGNHLLWSIPSVRLSECSRGANGALSHLSFPKGNEHIWMIFQVEQEIARDTFGLGKMIHLLLRNTLLIGFLRLHPNTRCSPLPCHTHF